VKDFSKFFPLFVHRCVVSAAHSTGMPKTKCLENSPADFAPLLQDKEVIFQQGGCRWQLVLRGESPYQESYNMTLDLLPGQENSIGGGFKDQFGEALARELNGE
jgi:hypothetical protein